MLFDRWSYFPDGLDLPGILPGIEVLDARSAGRLLGGLRKRMGRDLAGHDALRRRAGCCSGFTFGLTSMQLQVGGFCVTAAVLQWTGRAFIDPLLAVAVSCGTATFRRHRDGHAGHATTQPGGDTTLAT